MIAILIYFSFSVWTYADLFIPQCTSGCGFGGNFFSDRGIWFIALNLVLIFALLLIIDRKNPINWALLKNKINKSKKKTWKK